MQSSNLAIFVSELVGTFGLLVAATGSIVYDGRTGELLGPIFIAVMHFVGLAILVYAFGKYSLAHFNPAVTIGYFIAGYTTPKQLPVYFSAQVIGALLGSLFVKYAIGDYAQLGINFANYSYSVGLIYGIEVIATIFLMGIILIVVHKKSLNRLTGVAIGGIVALDVFFFGPISGASMNPIRSLAPALMVGIYNDLWLYWTAPFIGSTFVGMIYRKKFLSPLKKSE
jgi:aquaporin Z